jgi:hypothetical protein
MAPARRGVSVNQGPMEAVETVARISVEKGPVSSSIIAVMTMNSSPAPVSQPFFGAKTHRR